MDVHEARRPDRELAMHVSSVPATVAPEVSNTLHLSCEAEAVLAMDVDLIVPSLVVRERGRNFYLTAAAQHKKLGVLLLDDKALLDQAYRHSRSLRRSSVSCAATSMRPRLAISSSLVNFCSAMRPSSNGLSGIFV